MNTNPTRTLIPAIDWNARARARYTDPVVAVARVMECATQRDQLERASYMLSIARNPQNRFDLTREQVPATVVSALESIVAELTSLDLDAPIRALAVRYRELQAQGFAQDEIWGRLESDAAPIGFRYDDSMILESLASKLPRE